MYSKVTFRSPRSGAEYEFVVEEDQHSANGGLVAVCPQGDAGGLCTCAAGMVELLLVMVPDCVETWETK